MSFHSPRQILFEWLGRLPTNLTGSAIVADTPLIDGGVLDSLAILELVSFLEQTFSITLPLEDFVPENFQTPAAILVLIDRLRVAAGSK